MPRIRRLRLQYLSALLVSIFMGSVDRAMRGRDGLVRVEKLLAVEIVREPLILRLFLLAALCLVTFVLGRDFLLTGLVDPRRLLAVTSPPHESPLQLLKLLQVLLEHVYLVLRHLPLS